MEIPKRQRLLTVSVLQLLKIYLLCNTGVAFLYLVIIDGVTLLVYSGFVASKRMYLKKYVYSIILINTLTMAIYRNKSREYGSVSVIEENISLTDVDVEGVILLCSYPFKSNIHSIVRRPLKRPLPKVTVRFGFSKKVGKVRIELKTNGNKMVVKGTKVEVQIPGKYEILGARCGNKRIRVEKNVFYVDSLPEVRLFGYVNDGKILVNKIDGYRGLDDREKMGHVERKGIGAEYVDKAIRYPQFKLAEGERFLLDLFMVSEGVCTVYVEHTHNDIKELMEFRKSEWLSPGPGRHFYKIVAIETLNARNDYNTYVEGNGLEIIVHEVPLLEFEEKTFYKKIGGPCWVKGKVRGCYYPLYVFYEINGEKGEKFLADENLSIEILEKGEIRFTKISIADGSFLVNQNICVEELPIPMVLFQGNSRTIRMCGDPPFRIKFIQNGGENEIKTEAEHSFENCDDVWILSVSDKNYEDVKVDRLIVFNKSIILEDVYYSCPCQDTIIKVRSNAENCKEMWSLAKDGEPIKEGIFSLARESHINVGILQVGEYRLVIGERSSLVEVKSLHPTLWLRESVFYTNATIVLPYTYGDEKPTTIMINGKGYRDDIVLGLGEYEITEVAGKYCKTDLKIKFSVMGPPLPEFNLKYTPCVLEGEEIKLSFEGDSFLYINGELRKIPGVKIPYRRGFESKLIKCKERSRDTSLLKKSNVRICQNVYKQKLEAGGYELRLISYSDMNYVVEESLRIHVKKRCRIVNQASIYKINGKGFFLEIDCENAAWIDGNINGRDIKRMCTDKRIDLSDYLDYGRNWLRIKISEDDDFVENAFEVRCYEELDLETEKVDFCENEYIILNFKGRGPFFYQIGKGRYYSSNQGKMMVTRPGKYIINKIGNKYGKKTVNRRINIHHLPLALLSGGRSVQITTCGKAEIRFRGVRPYKFTLKIENGDDVKYKEYSGIGKERYQILLDEVGVYSIEEWGDKYSFVSKEEYRDHFDKMWSVRWIFDRISRKIYQLCLRVQFMGL
jgi:hypothetical protein